MEKGENKDLEASENLLIVFIFNFPVKTLNQIYVVGLMCRLLGICLNFLARHKLSGTNTKKINL